MFGIHLQQDIINNMENSFIKKTDENGVEHFVNPKYEKIFDGEEFVELAEEIAYQPTGEEVEQYELAQKIANAKKYLSETDWYVTRNAETGVLIPQDILEKRAQARIDCN